MTGALLIADDSQEKIHLLQDFLMRSEWKGSVLIAKTTEDAMQRIDENDVSFAFIDYYIPSHNGPAVIKYLKNKNPSARIALVSSSSKQSNFEEAKRVGAETCICVSDQADIVENEIMGLLENWKM